MSCWPHDGQPFGRVEQVVEPTLTDGNANHDAILLHDTVPGGTEYLADLAEPAALAALLGLAWERSGIVLPDRIRTAEEYLRVRRPGRGVALDRPRRHQVWDLVDAYRAQTRLDGTLDYAEAAAVAAAHLETTGPLVDHVLVDEGQDLSRVHWRMLRALVAPGPDDLFLAEDSHQRIYSPPVVLGRYGIRIVGRSRRLTLNYRTTAQNLRCALGILEGGSYVDLEENAEPTGYRSAEDRARSAG